MMDRLEVFITVLAGKNVVDIGEKFRYRLEKQEKVMRVGFVDRGKSEV